MIERINVVVVNDWCFEKCMFRCLKKTTILLRIVVLLLDLKPTQVNLR